LNRHDTTRMELTDIDFLYIGTWLGSFFFGLYSGIFAVYLQCHASPYRTDKGKNIAFYALSVLYVLSGLSIATQITFDFFQMGPTINHEAFKVLYITHGVAFACCDFIAQSILIYRCWIVWGRNTRVVVVPLILTIGFLATWIVGTIPTSSSLYFAFIMSGLVMSMVVNAVVTVIIVLKILKVFCQVRTTADDHILGVTNGGILQRVIFILIESGMALFFIQVFRIVVTVVNTDAANNAYGSISCIHQVLNGITPTIILVRVSMGLSFHDENSLVDRAGSLHFACTNSNQIPETGSVGNQERSGINSEDIEIP